MPKRTNAFQHLIARIYKAAAQSCARVTESHLTQNFVSGADEEIDVVIEHELAGEKYATLVACQDRSRKAGADWIRALKTQRDHCRAQKVIAVHSKGFSRHAKKTAEAEGITLHTLREVNSRDLRAALGLPERLVATYVIVHDIIYNVRPMDSSDVVPNMVCTRLQIQGREVTADEFTHRLNKQMHDILNEQLMQMWVPQLPIAHRNQLRVSFSYLTPDEDIICLNEHGSRIVLGALCGEMRVEVAVEYGKPGPVSQLGQIAAQEQTFRLKDANVSLLMAATGGHVGIHVEEQSVSSSKLRVDKGTRFSGRHLPGWIWLDWRPLEPCTATSHYPRSHRRRAL